MKEIITRRVKKKRGDIANYELNHSEDRYLQLLVLHFLAERRKGRKETIKGL